MTPQTILITDDENNVRTMLRAALETEGYDIHEASNGHDALTAIQHQQFDLLLLDLNMPVLDGMAVLKKLHSMAQATQPKVVVLTAYASIKAAVQATRLGAVDFLEKPITPVELRQCVKSVLDEPDLDPRPEVSVSFPGSYDHAVARIRKALRLADFENAEAMLMKAADRKQTSSAEYYNLLGVLYEAQRQWRLARKCYGKAIAADKQYQPAQLNMRRLYELYTFGKSEQSVVLGDEFESAGRFGPANIAIGGQQS
jgi:CheY-like chemotaxis protein